jgi:hypothetical protein
MKISTNDTITDIEIVDGRGRIVTPDEIPQTLDQQLTEWLVRRNIDPSFYIEDEAKEMVLTALQDPDFESAYIDEENGLVINFKE